MRICPSLHGGALDHPKITSMSIGEVMQKWDFCFEKVQSEATNQNENNGKALPPTMNSDDEVYEKLTGLKINSNSCPSDQNSSFSDLGSRDTPEEFFSAVSESSSKLTIYNTDFIKDLLGQGEMASLLPILSGMNFKVHKYVIGMKSPSIFQNNIFQNFRFGINEKQNLDLQPSLDCRW